MISCIFVLILQAEDEERRRRNDELKLKIALERSVNEKLPDGSNIHVNKFLNQQEQSFKHEL